MRHGKYEIKFVKKKKKKRDLNSRIFNLCYLFECSNSNLMMILQGRNIQIL